MMRRASPLAAVARASLLVAPLLLTCGCATQMVLSKIAKQYMQVIDAMPEGEAAVGLVYIPGIVLPKGTVIYDCGPETLTAVFTHWGKPLSIEEVAKETYRVKDKGTLSIDLMLFSRRRGFHAEMQRGSLLGLQKAILKGIPPIIMLDVATLPIYNIKFADPKSKFHFLAVTGYNDNTEEIMCELYEGQKVLIHYRYLRKAWEKAGFFMLLVSPPEWPRPA